MYIKEESKEVIERIEKNKTTLKNIYKVFETGNFNELDNYIAENIVEHTPDPLVQGTGLNYVKDLFKAYRTAFPDLKFNINDILTESDRIVAYITMTGTNQGTIMGKSATNKKVKCDGFDLVKFNKDGKVAEHWGVWDNLTMMTQLGFVPEMAGATAGASARK